MDRTSLTSCTDRLSRPYNRASQRCSSCAGKHTASLTASKESLDQDSKRPIALRGCCPGLSHQAGPMCCLLTPICRCYATRLTCLSPKARTSLY